jgi:hypothetical protein
MKTKEDGFPRAFKPYLQEEVNLILSLVPTHTNVKNLAESLGRTPEAIEMVYRYAYSGKWLKRDLAIANEEGRNNILTKTGNAKKMLGILIGHEPD